jgi:thioredoxin 1
MRTVITILFVLGAALVLRAEVPADWSTNYSAIVSPAAAKPRPTIVFFTASWCGPCKLMTRIILTDPVVKQALTNVEHVAVDIDEHPDVASQYGIQAVPTFVLLAADEEVDRSTGFRAADDFLAWLTNGVHAAQAAAVQLAQGKVELAEADQLLASTDTNSTRLAAGKLFDLCAGRDDAFVLAASGRLNRLAARDPGAVLDGLNDARLAARIQAANALRATVGDSFDVDPWGEATARQRAVAAWRERLANVRK